MVKPAIDIVAINGVRFVVTSGGFGQHDRARAAALRRLVVSLGRHTPSVLVNLAAAALRDLAGAAVRAETKDWRCWSAGYPGVVPELVVNRE